MRYVIAGLVLGAIPGIHQNLLALLPLPPQDLFDLVFASLFSSIIPALLFIPPPSIAPSLLPGQALVNRGKMGKAIMEYAGGALFASLLFVLLAPLYSSIATFFFSIRKFTFFLLLLLFLLPSFVQEKRKIPALLTFLLSGLYGYYILSKGTKNALLAHFSAMFGLTGILMSKKIPEQKAEPFFPSFDIFSVLNGTIGGILISLVPSLTPSQASAFLFYIFKKPGTQIASVGALAASSFLFSFLSLYYVGKGRMAAVENVGVIGSVLFVSLLSFSLLYLALAKIVKFASFAYKFKKIIASMIVLYLFFYARSAFLFLFPSFLLGLLPYKLKVNRVHLMGSLAFPTLLWYFAKLK